MSALFVTALSNTSMYLATLHSTFFILFLSSYRLTDIHLTIAAKKIVKLGYMVTCLKTGTNYDCNSSFNYGDKLRTIYKPLYRKACESTLLGSSGLCWLLIGHGNHWGGGETFYPSHLIKDISNYVSDKEECLPDYIFSFPLAL